MTYAGRLECHLRHLKRGDKSPYAEEFKDYKEPEVKKPNKVAEKPPIKEIKPKSKGVKK